MHLHGDVFEAIHYLKRGVDAQVLEATVVLAGSGASVVAGDTGR